MKLRDLQEKIQGRTAVFTFGRMNPPTIGHEKLLNKVKDVAGRNSGDWFVYLSSTQDAKKNPLPFQRKFYYARKMFGKEVNKNTFPQEPTALHAASSLFSKGYKKLIMVVGSDRVSQFDKLLNTYNNQDKPHGFYNFDSIKVVSAGERDPDAEGIEGMSASKLRAFAVQGKFNEFNAGLPGLNERDAKSLFNEIRKGLKLQAISEKIKIQKEVIPEKVTMKTSTFKDIFKREKVSEDIMQVLRRKAEVSGIPLSVLKSIYEKSVKQYKLGHEIGEVKEQYAMQKVNTHLLENKNIDDADEKFKEWMKMNEATDVVVNTPTGRYTTKTDSVAKTKNQERNKFRSAQDRKNVTVKRATNRDKKYLDRESDIREGMSRPHVFVGVKDKDPTSNLRPSVSYRPGKSDDFILIKPVDTNFFNENLKELVNSPYDFLEELGLHTNFGILIRDKGNEKAMVNAIAKKKSFSTSGYYGDKVYAVDTNENRLRKTLESAIQEEAPPGREHQVKSLKKKVGEKKAYAFAWAQHNKHGLPDTKEEVEIVEREGLPTREYIKKSWKDRAIKNKERQTKKVSHPGYEEFKKEGEVELTEWDFDPNTLLQQLGGNKFIVMTGAKNLMVDKEEKSLHMRIGKNSKGINHLKITYMPDDTYTMDFGRIRKLDYKVVRSVTNVYAEALQDVFTEVTGMYTSL